MILPGRNPHIERAPADVRVLKHKYANVGRMVAVAKCLTKLSKRKQTLEIRRLQKIAADINTQNTKSIYIPFTHLHKSPQD